MSEQEIIKQAECDAVEKVEPKVEPLDGWIALHWWPKYDTWRIADRVFPTRQEAIDTIEIYRENDPEWNVARVVHLREIP